MTDDHVNITDEDVRHLELPANWQPAARMGARGSTFHQAEDVAQEETHVSTVKGNLWAGGQLMVWRPAHRLLSYSRLGSLPGYPATCGIQT